MYGGMKWTISTFQPLTLSIVTGCYILNLGRTRGMCIISLHAVFLCSGATLHYSLELVDCTVLMKLLKTTCLYNWFLLNTTGTFEFETMNFKRVFGFGLFFYTNIFFRNILKNPIMEVWQLKNNQQSKHFFYQHIIFRSYLHDIRWLLSSPACSPQHVTIDSFYYSFVLFTNSEYGSPFRTKRWTLKHLVKNSLSPMFCISCTRVSKAVWSSIYCLSVVWVRL